MLSANLSAIFYLISGVLFILALRGLSSPETSRQGNFFGILGMIIAITVTFLSIGNFSTGFVVVLIFLLIGGLIGAFIAYKIPMTAMPELVAGFHSLVGLAAVFVAIAAFLNPEAFNLGSPGNIKLGSLIEMSIGAAVGAITFSGSIIAFLKLQGIMSGSPITFKGQHPLNALILISIIVLIYLLCSTQSSNLFWILLSSFFFNWFFINHSNWWCRYAGSDFNAKLLFWMGGGWNWFYFRKYSFNYHRCISRFIWCNSYLT
jgi:NAD(P) transhydrogenase subunit beta